MPLTILKEKSPYEILFGKPPQYDMLKPFGCLCFASNLKKERIKFDPRANPCIFLGYAQRQKGYKLYNIYTKQYLFQEMWTSMKFLFLPYHGC